MWFSTTRRTGERGTRLMISTCQTRSSFTDTPGNNLQRGYAMSLALSFRWPSSRNAQMLFAAFGLMAVAVMISSSNRKPRPWRVEEVPVAFWCWRNQTPAAEDVRAAVDTTRARAIFLRAGQIDFHDGKLSRIRSVSGPLPKETELHLVYNATRTLLAQLEVVDERALADTIAESFHEDSTRAAAENARVAGLQVDIDVPTRLLGRYQRMLKALRNRLEPGRQLSITGLPTWMQSRELTATLAQVDFWIPQFYGAEIPLSANQSIPISSPQDVERFVNRARELNKPFYAGLAAYSYALLYSKSGALITLRGDMDPAAIAADANLELTDQGTFAKAQDEWRFVYRARADGVIDGLVMHAGDVLVVDSPSAESLRVSARLVRESGGEKLIGICVFRLPAADDPASLTIAQVATALADRDSSPNFKINFSTSATRPRNASLEIENAGTANAVDGFRIDVTAQTGTIDSIIAPPGASIETLCRLGDKQPEQPCSQQRANLIRITARSLRSGASLGINLIFKSLVPKTLPVSLETRTDAGQTFRDQQELHLTGE